MLRADGCAVGNLRFPHTPLLPAEEHMVRYGWTSHPPQVDEFISSKARVSSESAPLGMVVDLALSVYLAALYTCMLSFQAY
ncbi:hypothetical protein VCV18_006456 [Metarhizium anisopliae]